MKPLDRQQIARSISEREAFLDEVVGSISEAPIRERQIRHDELLVFGDHDPEDGSITLNVPLLRVLVALHELTHRVRPQWTEDTVRRRSRRLLHMLTDDDVARVNRELVAAVRASR
jgi:hypothetical protein